MSSQRFVANEINDREYLCVLLALIIVVFLLDLLYSFQSQPMRIHAVPFGNSDEGVVDLLVGPVGDQLDRRILNDEHEAKRGDEDGKDEDEDDDPLPIVDQVEGDRVDEDADCE
jgi:hypothetical protein